MACRPWLSTSGVGPEILLWQDYRDASAVSLWEGVIQDGGILLTFFNASTSWILFLYLGAGHSQLYFWSSMSSCKSRCFCQEMRDGTHSSTIMLTSNQISYHFTRKDILKKKILSFSFLESLNISGVKWKLRWNQPSQGAGLQLLGTLCSGTWGS